MKVITSESDLVELSKDAGLIVRRPRRGYVAESEHEVEEVLLEASRQGIPVTARGAGTSIPSQAVGTGYLLLQAGAEAEFQPDGRIWCDPGIVKAELNKQLDSTGTWVPVDPSSYKSCTIGGMTANNSSGARTYKYGSTIDHVGELRVVLPEVGPTMVKPIKLDDALHAGGTTSRLASLLVENEKAIREDCPKVTKNSSGYRLERVVHDGLFDLPKLFVGSEGTLAVITKVMLATREKPRSRVLVVFEVGLSELDRVAAALRAYGPSAVELVDKSVFRQTGREDMIRPLSRSDEQYLVFGEFDGAADKETEEKLLHVSDDRNLAQFDPLVLIDAAEVSNAWDVRNETLTIAGEMRKGPRLPMPGVEDLVAPPEKLGAVLKLLRDAFESRGLDYISYGHAGDANLHMRPLLDPSSDSDVRVMKEIMDECFEAVWKMEGSMTGEHGDGLLRAPYVERQYRRSFWLMEEVKKLFDPKNVLNPGVKVPVKPSHRP
jgi:FAD/FMN-containing dehydrogenase